MSQETQNKLSFANKNGVLVLSQNEISIKAIVRPNVASHALSELHRYYQLPVEFEEVSNEAFSEALSRVYQQETKETMASAEEIDMTEAAEELITSEEILDTGNEGPVIRLINATLREAIEHDASDIHFETFEKVISVRFRIDGILREVLQLKRNLAQYIIARIKVMAKLDIAEKRVPQDGRISLTIAGRPIDVRVSIIPTSFSERVVLRLLDQNTTQLKVEQIGFSEENLLKAKNIIKSSYGIILVTGPTGSGKTTTLYAMLNSLNSKDRNILTIEDPIEYLLPGIGQMQTNEKVDMTFAKGLRAILRQDPDIIMVGEIRDLETAEVAVQASLTGHLVFSTLHTNTAIDAIIRLEDMGLEPYLICSSLVAIIGQRLVRGLCTACRQSAMASADELNLLGAAPSDKKTIYKAKGCSLCDNTGYKGRVMISEVLTINEELRSLLKNKSNEKALKSYMDSHIVLMQQDGFNLVERGITSLDEVIRVMHKV